MKVKVIANYLPQYHRTPENDKWWGEGFTDWISAKKALPLFEGHRQPRIPMNNHYYSLDEVNEIKWQAELARTYGVYGFGIYHYWFSSDQNLLCKPAELLLKHQEIDINFLFLWDNTSWIRTWSNLKHANDWVPMNDTQREQTEANGILADLIYGDEHDWEDHFMYLLPFFKDRRYIKQDNKPLFGFMAPNNNRTIIKKMIAYWDKLAKSNGFDGILCMVREHCIYNAFRHRFRFAPLIPTNKITWVKLKLKDKLAHKKRQIRFYDYDKLWNEILHDAKKSPPNTFLSGFVQFDDTPRRGKKGRIILGESPEKFEKYMKELLKISKEQNKEYVFLTAWNEWGEGCYLEPDSVYGTQYLEALKNAMDQVNP